MGSVTLFCVFCLSSLRNEVKKLIFCTIFHKFDSFFYLILTLPKCTPFLCHMAEKRLLLPPFPLFNVKVMLSRTLTYMLTYDIDLGDGGRGKVALPN